MKNLIVYGAGKIGEYVCTNEIDVFIDEYDDIFLYDNDKNKQGKILYGLYVLSEEEYENKVMDDSTKIVIATDYWSEIYKECVERGIENKILTTYNKYNCCQGKNLAFAMDRIKKMHIL